MAAWERLRIHFGSNRRKLITSHSTCANIKKAHSLRGRWPIQTESHSRYALLQKANSLLKQNVPGLTLCLCMAACGHSADGQLGLAFEEFPDAFHLLVEVAALRGSEVVEW